MTIKRCAWVSVNDPLMLQYHDREWGVPVHDDRKHFEFLVLEAAQAGLSCSIVLKKREGYRSAFNEFDPVKVARYTEKRIQKLTLDPAIIRNRMKIEAAVRNARAFLAIQREMGSFDAYCWRFVDGRPKFNRWKAMREIPATSRESDAFSKDLKRRGFTFVGSTIIYAHMQAMGMVNDHLVDCFRYREVRRLDTVNLDAWDAYIQKANLEMGDRLHGRFLWVEEVPDRMQRVRAGDILVWSVGQHNPKPVPSGLIHDWIGAAFIPGARLEDVLSTARDYSHYKEFYKPTVVDSKSLGSAGACDNYSMLLTNKEEVASTALDSEYQVCYHQVDEERWYSVAYATRVQEVRHYGRSDVQKLPPGQGSGYIWRLYSFARFEERDGGVYVELEAIALSRDIPLAARWVVDPIVRRVSKNSILISLRQTEEAVRSRAATANHSAKPFGTATSSSEDASVADRRHNP